jgi:hypothetical protein
MFQLSQIAAQVADCALLVALVCALQAWAYGMMGHEEQATKLIERARDELTKANHAHPGLLQLVMNRISGDGRSRLTLIDAIVVEIERQRLGGVNPLALVDGARRAS